MIRIMPESLSGPRAYFTEFDPRIIARTGNRVALRRRSERKLKVLLLLKGRVICAASHLATAFAYELFRDNAILFESGAIVPALRSDKSDIAELFSRKRFAGKEDAARFFSETVRTTVTWELDENSTWFRDRFLSDLEDEKSVLRQHFGNDYRQFLVNLSEEIGKQRLLARELVESVSKGLPLKYRRLLLNYRELLYHLSGARVVNCESALPQENYIDYDLADLRQRRVRLSDEQVLWKLLVELVLDSLQRALLPIEVLDSLSFEDVMKIRQPLLSSTFQAKYDELINSVMRTQGGGPNKIYDANELEKIRSDLAQTFAVVLEKELPALLKKQAIDQAKRLASVSSSVALNFMGAVPGIGVLSSAIGVLKDSPSLFFNLGQTYGSMRSIHDLKSYYARKKALLDEEIKQSEISDKAPLLEMVNLLMRVLAQRISL